ncbi:MAG: MFS transporter [Bacteroidota bacterium]
MKQQKIFSRTVILLSLVSLFNDISSEMLVPILPVYLSSIGFTAIWIGILEGMAEAVAGFSKAYFGKLSDSFQHRTPFVRWGYALSAVSKSMMAIFTFTWWVFLSRTMDRLGKGVRTASRDALLADESEPRHRGKIFGLNKAMDTIGATIGTAVAAFYLFHSPGDYKSLFLIAFFPAIVAVAITFIVREKQREVTTIKKIRGVFSFFGYWKNASPAYKKLVTGFLVFAIFNSSDAFIFLIGKHCGLSDTVILSAYIFYNIAFASLALPFGHLGDKVGMKFAYIIGIVFFGLAYFIFPYSSSSFIFFLAFFVYAFFAASTDGISKAWITKNCEPNEKATALGFYSGTLSIVILFSNLLAGFLWSVTSPETLFLVSVGGAVVTLVYFYFYSPVEIKGSST